MQIIQKKILTNCIKIRYIIKKENQMKTTLSDQALGAVMLALQKSLMEQSDIVPVLKGMNFEIDDSGELVVTNPPDIDLSQVEFKEE